MCAKLPEDGPRLSKTRRKIWQVGHSQILPKTRRSKCPLLGHVSPSEIHRGNSLDQQQRDHCTRSSAVKLVSIHTGSTHRSCRKLGFRGRNLLGRASCYDPGPERDRNHAPKSLGHQQTPPPIFPHFPRIFPHFYRPQSPRHPSLVEHSQGLTKP